MFPGAASVTPKIKALIILSRFFRLASRNAKKVLTHLKFPEVCQHPFVILRARRLLPYPLLRFDLGFHFDDEWLFSC